MAKLFRGQNSSNVSRAIPRVLSFLRSLNDPNFCIFVFVLKVTSDTRSTKNTKSRNFHVTLVRRENAMRMERRKYAGE